MSFNGDLYPTAGADVVMTTSGDMIKYESGARARLGIGSANQILQVKSSLPSWETLSTAGSVLTTQGDILYESASGLARLGQSTDGFVLTTKGAGANPVWASAGGGGAYTLIETKTVSGSTTNAVTFTLSPVITPPDAVFVTVSGEWDDTQELGMQLNGLTSNYNEYGAIYKPSALSAIAITADDHWDFVDNNMSDNEHGFASGLYRANPVTQLLEGTAIGGGNKGWISIACHNTTASQTDIDEVKITTLSGSNYIRSGTEISVYKLSGS
jgi:hypothetical protein